MPAADVAKLLAEHLRALRADAGAGITADGHQADFHREGDLANQVAAEDHRAGQDRHDGDLGLAGHAAAACDRRRSARPTRGPRLAIFSWEMRMRSMSACIWIMYPIVGALQQTVAGGCRLRADAARIRADRCRTVCHQRLLPPSDLFLRVQRFLNDYVWFHRAQHGRLAADAAALLLGVRFRDRLGCRLFLIGFALVTFPGKRKLTARVLRGPPATGGPGLRDRRRHYFHRGAGHRLVDYLGEYKETDSASGRALHAEEDCLRAYAAGRDSY